MTTNPMSEYVYTCFNCDEMSPAGNTEDDSTEKANAAGFVIGHACGQAHYSCAECKDLLFDPLPLLVLKGNYTMTNPMTDREREASECGDVNLHEPTLIEKLSSLAKMIEDTEGWRPTCIDEAIAALSTEAQPEMKITFQELRQANIARDIEWGKGQVFGLSYRGNELAGETGEACNVLKKLDRERMGLVGSRATKEEAGDELADVMICADLAAMELGIDLSEALSRKFNRTSDKYGLQTKLPEIKP